MSSSRHAVVVSYLALFVALGGTAAALQGKHSVKADDLATNSVPMFTTNSPVPTTLR